MVGKTFASLFPRSGTSTDGSGKPSWRIAGSGVSGEPGTATSTRAIIDFLKGEGVVVREWGQPGMGADIHYVQAKFLDGELSGTTGNYIGGSRGSQLSGARAALFVALGLGLKGTETFRQTHALVGVTLEQLRAELTSAPSEPQPTPEPSGDQ